jgi:hypothetical protein
MTLRQGKLTTNGRICRTMNNHCDRFKDKSEIPRSPILDAARLAQGAKPIIATQVIE